MRTNDSKTSVDSKLEEMEEKYPVEQIAVKNEKKKGKEVDVINYETKEAQDRKSTRLNSSH